MKKLLLILPLFFTLGSNAYSQEYFDCTFGNSQNEVGKKILQENDSILTLFGWGANYSFYLVKCDLHGDTIVTKSYDFPYFNLGTDMFKLPHSGYILIGRDGGIIKINENLEIDWTKHNKNYTLTSGIIFNDTTILITGSKPVFSHVDTIPDGGIDSVFYSDIILKQFNFEGDFLKELSFSFVDKDHEIANDIIIMDETSVVITGFTNNSKSYRNLFLIKLDSELNTKIDTMYERDNKYVGYEVVENSSNQLIITGYKQDLINGRKDIFITKINKSGHILWEQQIDLWKDSDELYCSGIGTSVIESKSGNLYTFGSLSDGNNGPDQVRNLFLIKSNNDGDTIFTKIIDNTGNKMSGSLIELSENKLALFGSSDYLTNGEYDMYLIFSDSLGNFESSTGIDRIEVQNPSFIYPNPASDILNVELELVQSIEIIDMQGRLQKRLIGNHKEICIDDITSGLYIIQVKTEKGILSNRMIIK